MQINALELIISLAIGVCAFVGRSMYTRLYEIDKKLAVVVERIKHIEDDIEKVRQKNDEV
jgi:hypothetical protein